ESTRPMGEARGRLGQGRRAGRTPPHRQSKSKKSAARRIHLFHPRRQEARARRRHGADRAHRPNLTLTIRPAKSGLRQRAENERDSIYYNNHPTAVVGISLPVTQYWMKSMTPLPVLGVISNVMYLLYSSLARIWQQFILNHTVQPLNANR